MTEKITKVEHEAVITEDDKPSIRVGYVVGIDSNDNIVFDFVGSSPAIVELLGLHKVAEERIRTEMETGMNMGYPALSNSLNKISEILAQMLNMFKTAKKDSNE